MRLDCDVIAQLSLDVSEEGKGLKGIMARAY